MLGAFEDDYQPDSRRSWTGPGPAPLLVDRMGRRLDRHDVTRILRRLARAARIPRPEKVTPHSLRATAITDQKRRGRQPADIQHLTDHADIRIVMIYVDADDRDQHATAITTDLGRIMTAVPERLRNGR